MSTGGLRAMMERVARVAAELTSAPDAPTYHHLLPQSYIRRWAPDRKGSIRSVRIADGRWKLVGPRKVGGIDDFYRLDADDIDDSRTPPLVIEVLLGELDKLASTWIDQFLAVEPGPITDDGLKFDMALVVGAQMMRGESFRQEQLALLEYAAQQDPIEHSKDAARIWLGMTGQLIDDETVALTAAQMREKDRQSLISQDSKAQAIQLMMQNWTSAVMPLVARNWAIYRADTPLLTSDNPVVIVGGPSADRRIKPGYVPAPEWVYPIDRYRLLTCFRPDIQPRFPFVLDETETFEINREIVAAAYEMVFQHPDDDIASTIKVPPWPVVPKAESVVDLSRRPTRWLNDPNPPAPPVSRWYSMDVPPNRSSSLKGASSSAAIRSCQ